MPKILIGHTIILKMPLQKNNNGCSGYKDDFVAIKFCMFKDEIKDKLKINNVVLPYVVTLASGKTVISGVKKCLWQRTTRLQSACLLALSECSERGLKLRKSAVEKHISRAKRQG